MAIAWTRTAGGVSSALAMPAMICTVSLVKARHNDRISAGVLGI
jgi:hypothetical protein